jgi:CRP-like cAMP-binding protein
MVSASRHRLKDLCLRLGWGWDGASPKARSLQGVPLFGGCSPSELQMLVGLTCEVTVPAGTVLCQEGQGPAQFLILTNGRLEVTGNGAHPHACLPGSYLPSSGTRLDVADLPTVRAESDAEIIVMNAAEFATMMVLVPSVRELLRTASESEVVIAGAPSAPHVAATAGAAAT